MAHSIIGMITETAEKIKALIVDNRLSGPEQEIQRDILKLNGMLDRLSIDIVVSSEEYKSFVNRPGATHYDIIVVGVFDEGVKEEIMDPSKLKNGTWAFLYNGKADSDDYLSIINFYKEHIF